jgi:zinc protease
MVLNEVIGGGTLTSLLFDELREKRGLVYSVGTALVPLDHAALIIGSAGTNNERVSEAIQLIREQWQLVADRGVSGQQVADAKTYLTGSFPLRFTSTGRLATLLVSIQLDNLGPDYLERRNSLINAVTKEDVDRIAKTILTPRNLTFVVVGQPKGLAARRLAADLYDVPVKPPFATRSCAVRAPWLCAIAGRFWLVRGSGTR